MHVTKPPQLLCCSQTTLLIKRKTGFKLVMLVVVEPQMLYLNLKRDSLSLQKAPRSCTKSVNSAVSHNTSLNWVVSHSTSLN